MYTAQYRIIEYTYRSVVCIYNIYMIFHIARWKTKRTFVYILPCTQYYNTYTIEYMYIYIHGFNDDKDNNNSNNIVRFPIDFNYALFVYATWGSHMYGNIVYMLL